MTIVNADKLLSVITATITEDDDCFTIEDENLQVFKETLLIVIETIRKYQQIEQIYQQWNEVNDFSYNQAMQKIGEVVEDGKND